MVRGSKVSLTNGATIALIQKAKVIFLVINKSVTRKNVAIAGRSTSI
jgi:hypothetical protein